MLDALVNAVDNKDRYTRRHSEDVMAYSLLIARALGLDAATQQTLAQVAALLHDVGKIGVPDAVLRKPGAVDARCRFEAIKQHPVMGAVIVGAVPGLEGTLDSVRHHHERWDGMGYPDGLRGEETPPAGPPDGRRRCVFGDDLRPALPQGHDAHSRAVRFGRRRGNPMGPGLRHRVSSGAAGKGALGERPRPVREETPPPRHPQ